MNPKNPPNKFTDQDILKLFLALKREEEERTMVSYSRNKKPKLSIEEYAKQAVENLLDKLNIDHERDN